MDFKARRNKVREKLEAGGCVVLFPGSNMQYLTDLNVEPSERQFFLFVPKQQEPFVFAPELYREEVEEKGIESYFWSDQEDPKKSLEQTVDETGLNIETLLVDDRMWFKFSQDLTEVFPEADLGLASEIMRPIRSVKSDAELRKIREASQIADKVIGDVRDLDGVVGMTEKELAGYIAERMKEYGGEGESFPTIVAAGENGSSPHHEPSERKIRSGEPVVLDFGCWKDGYPSDQTRTLVFGGEPDEEFKKIFQVVRKAQKHAVKAVEPGKTTSEIDEVARSVIEEAGYGDEFVHRTGHGVGLEVHENPKIPEMTEQVELKEGMVFSIEPGIYLEGELGVRIEDLVVVTEDGCERLNTTSRSYEL